MLTVLGLVEVVMFANLLIMAKLATALIGKSSIHLLKTFINAGSSSVTDKMIL